MDLRYLELPCIKEKHGIIISHHSYLFYLLPLTFPPPDSRYLYSLLAPFQNRSLGCGDPRDEHKHGRHCYETLQRRVTKLDLAIGSCVVLLTHRCQPVC